MAHADGSWFAFDLDAQLWLVSPFMSVLFERGAGADAAALRAERLAGWPDWLRGLVEGALLDASPMVALERVVFFLLAAFLIRNAADYVQTVLMVSVEQATIRDIRAALFRHLQRLGLDFYHGTRAGEVMSRLTNDVDYLRAALVSASSNILKDGLSLIGYLLWAFYASWSLTLLALLVLPPLGWALSASGRRMRRRSERAQEVMADLVSLLQENVVGARVVYSRAALPE